MYEQWIPEEPVDRLREGLPNLRHGSVNQHPLEIAIEERRKTQFKDKFDELALLYGEGFANHEKMLYKLIKSTQIGFRTYERPDDLAIEVFTGDIDDVDFNDMFAPNGMRADIEFDPHEIQEKRLNIE